MEIVLVPLEINKMLSDEVQMAQTSFKVPLFEERFASLDYVPMVLQLVQRCLVTHEQSQNILTQLGLLASHQKFDTNVVHIPISQICLSGLVDSLQRGQIIVPFVFKLSPHKVKLRYSIRMRNRTINIIVSTS